MRKSKDEIIAELHQSFQSLAKVSEQVREDEFNVSKNNKWTTAENISHLVRSTQMTTLAFSTPKFLHVILYGKPSRTSHGCSKVVDNYQKKLSEGASASGIYIPKKTDYNKTQLNAELQLKGKKLITAISEKWTDEQLDNYQISHPILGLITVRELAYFTIYHNGHHLKTICELYL